MDKEEIIRRLKKISGHAVYVVGELPFIMSLDDGIALDEAVRLLKEQEPRVMTADEVQPDELVWIEVPQSDEIWPALLRREDWFDDPTWAMRGYALAGYYRDEGYGRDWRCWTARPTDEQREAVKWDDKRRSD